VYFYFFVFNASFWSPSLGTDDFENLQEFDEQDFVQQAGEQGK
jgi:hypothetical protein